MNTNDRIGVAFIIFAGLILAWCLFYYIANGHS